jgi:Outer membrane protein beta-barrel domain
MTRTAAAAALALWLTASAAGAQERTPLVTVVPADSPRWDVAGHITWLGEHRPAESFQWDRWFGVASGGGSVGYYWTAHLKTEFDLSTSNEGETYSVEFVPIPGLTSPSVVQRDHEIRFTTASAGLTGQFFENAWFHPFVSAGLELVREREHIETVPPPVPPRAPAVTPPAEAETRVRYSGRPYVGTGFKVYVSDHAFIRTDIRTSWSSDGLAALGWRSGVGVDF